MKKFIVNYTYDNEDEKYVAACPEFFGFILYAESKEQMFKSVLDCLKVYAEDDSITNENIKFIEKK